MSSPFPGMDPYLENPALWSGVHDGIISATRALLNASLPPQYAADVDERLYVVQSERDIRSDVVLIQPPTRSKTSETPGGAAAVADPPLQVANLPRSDEIREAFIKIIAPALDYKVITIIEVLSPTNKALDHPGRELYLKKQQEVLNSDVHLIEIDLLRSGEYTVAAPKDRLQARRRDYLVCLHRGGKGENYEVWASTLRDRLPRIWVPLGENDPDIVLDLQAVFDRCYEEGAYSRLIDYRQSPPPPLAFEDFEWVLNRLREAGLRP